MKIVPVKTMKEVLKHALMNYRKFGGKHMVIKHVALDIVCGITSKLPQINYGNSDLRENPMWENHH